MLLTLSSYINQHKIKCTWHVVILLTGLTTISVDKYQT